MGRPHNIAGGGGAGRGAMSQGWPRPVDGGPPLTTAALAG